MNVVIYGIGNMSSLAWYCLTHDSECQVIAFTVDSDYRFTDDLHGLPVIDFERIEIKYPPSEFAIAIPIGPVGMNDIRKQKFIQAKIAGYDVLTYISSKAHVWPDLNIAEGSFAYEHSVVQPFSRIGQGCIVRSNVNISHNVEIGDFCFVANSATIAGSTTIGESCFVGLNATILDGLKIADNCFIAAGALVNRDTEPGGIYIGSPARRAKKNIDEMNFFSE